jgi:hypothetical protein
VEACKEFRGASDLLGGYRGTVEGCKANMKGMKVVKDMKKIKIRSLRSGTLRSGDLKISRSEIFRSSDPQIFRWT